MGDHRLNVEISVVGVDGKKQKIDWWVNWNEDRPIEIFNAIIEMAKKAGLQANRFYEEDKRF